MKVTYYFKFLVQLLILWGLNQIGNVIVAWLSLPIPGNVFGMILLFVLLMTGVVKLEWIHEAASFLLKHLVFFFIPITVGVMTLGDLFLESGLLLIIVLAVSGAIGMIVTGWTSQLLSKFKESDSQYERRHHNL